MALRKKLECEREDLGKKIINLQAAIASPSFAGFRPVQQEQLPIQLDAMRAYQKCLRFRIEDLEAADEIANSPMTPEESVTIFDNRVYLSECGLAPELVNKMEAAGLFYVGGVRGECWAALEDGNDLLSLPWIDEENISVLTEKLLNDMDYAAPAMTTPELIEDLEAADGVVSDVEIHDGVLTDEEVSKKTS